MLTHPCRTTVYCQHVLHRVRTMLPVLTAWKRPNVTKKHIYLNFFSASHTPLCYFHPQQKMTMKTMIARRSQTTASSDCPRQKHSQLWRMPIPSSISEQRWIFVPVKSTSSSILHQYRCWMSKMRWPSCQTKTQTYDESPLSSDKYVTQMSEIIKCVQLLFHVP